MRYIEVNFQQEGTHRWKDCPFEDVAFLRDWHRHIFHFRVRVRVEHEDRQVEFIRLKRDLEQFAGHLLDTPLEWSCEKIAEGTASYLESKGYHWLEVFVSEDGENGGGVARE